MIKKIFLIAFPLSIIIMTYGMKTNNSNNPGISNENKIINKIELFYFDSITIPGQVTYRKFVEVSDKFDYWSKPKIFDIIIHFNEHSSVKGIVNVIIERETIKSKCPINYTDTDTTWSLKGVYFNTSLDKVKDSVILKNIEIIDPLYAPCYCVLNYRISCILESNNKNIKNECLTTEIHIPF